MKKLTLSLIVLGSLCIFKTTNAVVVATSNPYLQPQYIQAKKIIQTIDERKITTIINLLRIFEVDDTKILKIEYILRN